MQHKESICEPCQCSGCFRTPPANCTFTYSALLRFLVFYHCCLHCGCYMPLCTSSLLSSPRPPHLLLISSLLFLGATRQTLYFSAYWDKAGSPPSLFLLLLTSFLSWCGWFLLWSTYKRLFLINLILALYVFCILSVYRSHTVLLSFSFPEAVALTGASRLLDCTHNRNKAILFYLRLTVNQCIN